MLWDEAKVNEMKKRERRKLKKIGRRKKERRKVRNRRRQKVVIMKSICGQTSVRICSNSW
jgi:hypothetical protein